MRILARAGAVETDAEAVETDAEAVETDAGAVERDAGAVEMDAGAVEMDAGGSSLIRQSKAAAAACRHLKVLRDSALILSA